MKKSALLLTAVCFIILIPMISNAENEDQNKGAETIQLNGGALPEVTFPHRLHQTVLGDCNACHDLFPKAPKAIKELINNKTLQKQQVMNGKCIACHKAKQQAGAETGPIACNQCHVRK